MLLCKYIPQNTWEDINRLIMQVPTLDEFYKRDLRS